VLKSLEKKDLKNILDRAITEDEFLKTLNIEFQETEALMRISGGDARKLLNALELVVQSEVDHNADKIEITDKLVLERIQENIALYDKKGEMHYDIISAFIKSIRGSDPNAAVYYLARMIAAGEDPLFIARRMVILAAEDIGLANPNALLMANNCFQAVHVIGMPEGRIILSEAAIYLATSPKSNSAYMAINAALEKIAETGDLSIPLNIRNAPTGLMKELGYGKDYRYAHDFENNFIADEFLPKQIASTAFYKPQENPREKELTAYLHRLWKGKYGY
jgi:putative ATPase